MPAYYACVRSQGVGCAAMDKCYTTRSAHHMGTVEFPTHSLPSGVLLQLRVNSVLKHIFDFAQNLCKPFKHVCKDLVAIHIASVSNFWTRSWDHKNKF